MVGIFSKVLGALLLVATLIYTCIKIYKELLGRRRGERKNSPKFILEVGKVNERGFIRNRDRSIRYYPLTIRNEKAATKAKRVQVRLLDYYLRENSTSPYEQKLLPHNAHFLWAAPPDDESSTLSNFTTFDAFIIGIIEESGFFRLLTDPDLLEATGAVIKDKEILIKIEVTAENAITENHFFLHICLRELPYQLGGPFIAPSISELSEREFKQLTKKS